MAMAGSWKYEAFPELRPGYKVKLPLKIQLPSETLNATMNPKSGTHPLFGIDQMYISKKFSRRVLIKQDVKVSHSKIINRWMFLKDNAQVYHYRSGSSLVAIYAQNFNERELKAIEKQFVPISQRHQFKMGSSASLMPLKLIPSLVDCAFAELATGGGGSGGGSIGGAASRGGAAAAAMSGAHDGAEADAGEGMVRCLANKSKNHLIGQAQEVGTLAASAYDSTAEALKYAYDNPMQAAENTAGFLYGIGESVVSGVYTGAKATFNFGRRVVTEPEQVWDDINASIDRMEEFGRKVYAQLEEAIDGFNDLDPAVRNRLICEFGGMLIAEGLVGVVLGLTGAGATVAVAKLARTLNNFKNKVQTLLPAFRALSQSTLSGAEKQRLVVQLLEGKISQAEFSRKLSPPRANAAREAAGKAADTPGGPGGAAAGAGGRTGGSATATTMAKTDVDYLHDLSYETDFGKTRVISGEDVGLLSRADKSSQILANIDGEPITGTPDQIMAQIRAAKKPRTISVDGIRGAGNAALQGRPGLAKITDGDFATGISAFGNTADDTAIRATVMLKSGQSASFRGNKEMLVSLAESSDVESIILRTPPDWVPPLSRMTDADIAKPPGIAGVIGANPTITSSTRGSDLAGITVRHGTIDGMVDSVKAGPRNVGSGFGGRGLYLDLEPDARIADAYATMARSSASARTAAAGVSTTSVNPVVMTGRLNPEKNLRVITLQVSRDVYKPDFSKGIVPFDWADDPSIARYIERNFDVVEVRGARSAGFNLDTDRIIVVHERAGADAIIWEQVNPAK